MSSNKPIPFCSLGTTPLTIFWSFTLCYVYTGLEMYAVVFTQVEWPLALCCTHGSSQDHQLLTVLVHTLLCTVKALKLSALLIAERFLYDRETAKLLVGPH